MNSTLTIIGVQHYAQLSQHHIPTVKRIKMSVTIHCLVRLFDLLNVIHDCHYFQTVCETST